MKVNQALTAALVALGFVSAASADNVVYITGSTAFRSTVYAALHTAGTVFDASPAVAEQTFGNAAANGGSYMLFHGNINGTPTYIDCAWSGSEAGIASASNVTIDNDGTPLAGSPETWLKADGSITLSGVPQSSAPSAGQLEAASHQADLSMADTSQAVSLTPRVINTQTDLKDYGVVGIVPFTWVKNINTTPSVAWQSVTNISIPQMNALFSQGFEQAGFFTGVAAHTNQNVYLVGRNKGSGTRANELADSGYGTTRSVQQFSIGGGVSTATTGTLVLNYEGNNGYESGGGVAGALVIDGSCGQTDPFDATRSGWFAIGMLGISDATSKGLTTNNWLTAEGVFETDGAVEEGQYALWGHEHLFGKHNISGFQDTVGGKLFTGIQTALGTAGSVPSAHSAGILLQYMHADKSSDVAYPTRN